MPAGLTDFGANAWVAAMLGVAPITDYWIALLTDAPGPAMDGDILADLEPTDIAYRRRHYGVGAANWTAIGGGDAINTGDIDFGLPAADWGLLTHYALCTAQVSGDVYGWGEFLNPAYVTRSFHLIVPAGGIVLGLSQLDNPIAV